MFDVGAGLSTAGAAVAKTAGELGIEAQKAGLEQEKIRLADELLGAREEKGRQFTGGENEKNRELTRGEGMLNRSSEETRAKISAGATLGAAGISAGAHVRAAEIAANAPPEAIRTAQWFSKAAPEEQAAYLQQLSIKAGLPPYMAGAPRVGGASATSKPDPASPDGETITPEGTKPSPKASIDGGAAGSNDEAFRAIPPEAHGTAKAMIEGRLPMPTSFALAKPYWQNMMRYAQAVDPNFDATTWGSRNATRKDFANGQSAKAVTALNTALGHAGLLAENFDKLDNGSLPMWNSFVNTIGTQFGSDKVTNAKMAVDALASEARKVFAASGGGNLTELLEWQKNFPIDGSPTQQKGAMKQFVGLLDSRLVSLADQYNRGMGRTQDPLQLLEPKARQVFEKLSGHEPESATGYQNGRGPAAPPPPSQSSPSALPPPGRRVVGRTYSTPTGDYVWMGTGWARAPEQKPTSLRLPPMPGETP